MKTMPATASASIRSAYDQAVSRKRSWQPVAVTKGRLQRPDGQDALERGLALRHLELPVADFLRQGLEKELPSTPGVMDALLSNIADEERHDKALSYVTAAHGVNEKYEREGQVILQRWIDNPSHPILKAAVLERSVFFVLLPLYRWLGDMGLRTVSADISGDEQAHVAIHSMCASELGIKSNPGLNRLRRATVAWVVDGLGNSHEDKYLSKDFWMRSSDSLYTSGRAPELIDSRRATVPAFFEASNCDLPSYA